MTRRDVVGLVTALILTAPVAVTVWAASSPPGHQLRGAVEQVMRVAEDPDLKRPGRTAERRAAIRRIAAEIFDFQEITKRALGPHWQPRTPAEREEMIRLVTGLLERAYVAKIELYSGERITFTGDVVDGDLATVRTRVVTRQGTEIPVEYRMMRRGERWVAYDGGQLSGPVQQDPPDHLLRRVGPPPPGQGGRADGQRRGEDPSHVHVAEVRAAAGRGPALPRPAATLCCVHLKTLTPPSAHS
jgi:phospholipid transport system substrate-binding protein